MENKDSGEVGKELSTQPAESPRPALETGLPMYLECAMCGVSEVFVISKQDPSTGYCFAEKREWTLVARNHWPCSQCGTEYTTEDNLCSEGCANVQRRFRQHLDDASAVVSTWPKWERELLGRKSKDQFTDRTSPLTGKPYPRCQEILDSTQCDKAAYAEGKCYKHFQSQTGLQKTPEVSAADLKLLRAIWEFFNDTEDGAEDASYSDRMANRFAEPLEQLIKRMEAK